MSPQEMVRLERERLRVMMTRQVEYAYCEFCDDDTEHLEDGECLPCEKQRIAGMAEAAGDTRGYREWKEQNRPVSESRLDDLIGHSGDDDGEAGRFGRGKCQGDGQ